MKCQGDIYENEPSHLPFFVLKTSVLSTSFHPLRLIVWSQPVLTQWLSDGCGQLRQACLCIMWVCVTLLQRRRGSGSRKSCAASNGLDDVYFFVDLMPVLHGRGLWGWFRCLLLMTHHEACLALRCERCVPLFLGLTVFPLHQAPSS